MEGRFEFDPVHRMIRDARGRILKRVNCPRLKSWNRLAASGDNQVTERYCDSCDRAVLDTALMTGEEVVDAVTADPEICIRIRLDQDNVEIKVRHA